ncbi:RNA pseudouridine synthase [Sphingomonas sp. Leaf33]|uniref:RluA family pseudouridine synthase n=1 Tax=Sphingomonas sp. Leaf33 TaxID=1736215 RepID=UPI0006F86A22|nr:RNA pseudouridine synthase [Sphingomonas sp. Leaf33]KQN25710.1 RNA pseudouridine synthase [Sphingomonas sp. Leaf33]
MLADRIIFLDGEAIVLDKPAGLPVDSPRDRSPSVETMLGDLTFGFHRLPQPVHRIDRDTSGCLLLARNPGAMKRFGQAFEAGEVAKRYLAVLDGVPEGEGGLIDLPLTKVSTRESGWRMIGRADGKAARTHWSLVAVQDGRALVEFRPETGRTHQLRVHAATGLGLPIVGDPVYGSGGGEGMMLHAASLRLARPGKPPIEAEADLPARFGTLGFGN